MIDGFLIFLAVMVGIAFLAFIVLRIMKWYSDVWVKRYHEAPTKNILPCCPQCGGEFGKWSGIITNKIANNPSYYSAGTYDQQTQSRSCQDCGYGDRRVL